MTPELPGVPAPILLVQVGSRAYGTSLGEDSDHDFVALAIESKLGLFGRLEPPRSKSFRSQPVGQPSGPGDWDCTVHPLRRWVALASKGNPNALEPLWAPVVQTSWLGETLRDQAKHFIGRHLLAPYRGYIHAQMELVAKSEWPDFPAKAAMHTARLALQARELLTTGALAFPMGGSRQEWLKMVRGGEVGLNEWQLMMRDLLADLDRFKDDESIPAGPNLRAITEWSADAHLTWWSMMDGSP